MITIFCTVVLSTDLGNGTDTQVFHLNLKVGHYRMVSEHSVACRIETLGLELEIGRP
jgi:hypothetical protein